ncbi:MAG: DoxX family protein [Acidobacteriota bacterium]
MMRRLAWLGKYRDIGLLCMRLGLGVMFIFHGTPMLMGGPDRWAGLGQEMANLGITVAPVAWGFLAALSEAGGGVCLILGLFTRPACAMLLATMGVAVVHHLAAGEDLMQASHAIEDGVVFLGLIFLGPGRFSLDRT